MGHEDILASLVVTTTAVVLGPSPTEVFADTSTDTVWYGESGESVYSVALAVETETDPFW